MIIVFSSLQSFKPEDNVDASLINFDPPSNRLNYIATLCNREIQLISANGAD